MEVATMNREDIIRMAKQVSDEGYAPILLHPEIQRLCELVRADEREACAKVCEDEAWRLKKIAVDMKSGSTNMKSIQASIDAAAIRART